MLNHKLPGWPKSRIEPLRVTITSSLNMRAFTFPFRFLLTFYSSNTWALDPSPYLTVCKGNQTGHFWRRQKSPSEASPSLSLEPGLNAHWEKERLTSSKSKHEHFCNSHLDIGNVIDRSRSSNEMNILAVCSFGEVLHTKASWPPNFWGRGWSGDLLLFELHIPGPDSTSIGASCPWISF